MADIGPFRMTTAGGFPAVIDAFDPARPDLLAGIISTPLESLDRVTWSRTGSCIDRSDQCNLDPDDPIFRDALAASDRAAS